MRSGESDVGAKATVLNPPKSPDEEHEASLRLTAPDRKQKRIGKATLLEKAKHLLKTLIGGESKTLLSYADDILEFISERYPDIVVTPTLSDERVVIEAFVGEMAPSNKMYVAISRATGEGEESKDVGEVMHICLELVNPGKRSDGERRQNVIKHVYNEKFLAGDKIPEVALKMIAVLLQDVESDYERAVDEALGIKEDAEDLRGKLRGHNEDYVVLDDKAFSTYTDEDIFLASDTKLLGVEKKMSLMTPLERKQGYVAQALSMYVNMIVSHIEGKYEDVAVDLTKAGMGEHNSWVVINAVAKGSDEVVKVELNLVQQAGASIDWIEIRMSTSYFSKRSNAPETKRVVLELVRDRDLIPERLPKAIDVLIQDLTREDADAEGLRGLKRIADLRARRKG